MLRKYPKLFEDPHMHYPIDNIELNFADYIAKNKQIIAKCRVDLQQHTDSLIEKLAPYELKPEQPLFSNTAPNKIKYGALLIHGLLDTPFTMKDVGEKLQAQGLLVRSVLLPGHATVPGGLLNVTLESWQQALQYGFTSLAKEVDQIFLVGFSMGASLCLYHTLLNPNQVAGLIMLSPAFKINSPFAPFANWYKAIAWAWPRAKWLHVREEIDYARYKSLTLNAVYQVYRLTETIKKIDHTKQLPCPLFMALSYEDRIISGKAAINYFNASNNPKDRMVVYSKNNLNFDDTRILNRSSVHPKWNIETYSHVALPISPTNPHYGKYGDYSLASHVEEKNNYVYGSLDAPMEMFCNLLYKLKLTKQKAQLLTFNPDFDFMSDQIKEFIDSVETK